MSYLWTVNKNELIYMAKQWGDLWAEVTHQKSLVISGFPEENFSSTLNMTLKT